MYLFTLTYMPYLPADVNNVSYRKLHGFLPIGKLHAHFLTQH